MCHKPTRDRWRELALRVMLQATHGLHAAVHGLNLARQALLAPSKHYTKLCWPHPRIIFLVKHYNHFTI
jgi:hypothetical protein